jgi:hypothetical protein
VAHPAFAAELAVLARAIAVVVPEVLVESVPIGPMALMFSVEQTGPVAAAGLLVITLFAIMLLATEQVQAGIGNARAQCRLTAAVAAVMASGIAASPAAGDSARAAVPCLVIEDLAAARLDQPAIAADTAWAGAGSATAEAEADSAGVAGECVAAAAADGDEHE